MAKKNPNTLNLTDDIREQSAENRIRTSTRIAHTIEALTDIHQQLSWHPHKGINLNRESYIVGAIRLLNDYQSSLLCSLVDEYDFGKEAAHG